MSKVFKGLFGKSSGERRLRDFQPSGFSAPGLSGRFDRGSKTFQLTRGPGVQSAIDALRSGFQGLSNEIGVLRSGVSGGFSDLMRTRVQAIRDAAKRSVGDLRSELSRRRVQGSTFAQREIGAREADFARLEEEARAETFLQELAVSRDLIVQEYQAALAGIGAVLSQFNFESTLGAQLASGATQALASTTAAEAELGNTRRERNWGLFGSFLGFLDL